MNLNKFVCFRNQSRYKLDNRSKFRVSVLFFGCCFVAMFYFRQLIIDQFVVCYINKARND